MDTCRCFRTDVKMSESEERKLLGVKDAYPEIDRDGHVKSVS